MSDSILVKTLHIAEIDQNHSFTGLSNLKMNKKERHMKTLRDFAKFLEITNEQVVQEVLSLSRNFRETMEVVDEELNKFCKHMNEESYLLPKSEKELIHVLEYELKVKIQNRSDVVEKFAIDLDNTETKRAMKTGVELKTLVDQLISIAHQLPDDIEHIVENEAFELNQEIVTNKSQHAKTAAEHQIKQVTVEANCLQQWEDCRLKWRSLRHEKALDDFRNHIASSEFTNPSDRQKYMQKFRKSQNQKNQKLLAQFDKLKQMSCISISSETVQEVQSEFSNLTVEELNAIQSCYNELIRLQGDMNFNAKERVEALRRELHVYGALKIEPDLRKNSKKLQSALHEDSLSELWRLGGGLKSEFQAQVVDLCHPDVVYNRMIVAMQSRMEFIISSFDLKSILEERGRLSQLEKVRNLITKMRTVPRSEVAGVLNSLLPELNDIEEMDNISDFFKDQVRTIVREITTELNKQNNETNRNSLKPLSGTISGTQNIVKSSTAKPSSGTLSASTLNKTSSKKSSEANKEQITDTVDPVLVKAWNRKLGILYYGSDLPKEYQQACLDSLNLVKQQNECNDLVDIVVLQESEMKLKKLDKNYKKLIDQITTYLETQTSTIAQIATNIGDFFLIVAKMIEQHHKQQKFLDEKSADEIWDLKEEFRLEREDNEETYKNACQRIRESTKQDELQDCFEEVLKVLDKIAKSYRNYHSNACFANDRYPLMLIHEFRNFLNSFSKVFFLVPDCNHAIVTEYERIFDQTIRLNRKYFEENILIVGDMERIPLPDEVPNPYQQNRKEDVDDATGIQSNVLLSPYLQNKSEPPQDVYCGSFYWLQTFDDVVAKFKSESPFAVQPVDQTSSITDNVETNEMLHPVPEVVPHSSFPYIAENCPVLPLPSDELQALDGDELVEYEKAMIKYFIDIGDREIIVEEIPAPVAKGKASGGKKPIEVVPLSPLEKMSNDELGLYKEIKKFVESTKLRLAMEAEAWFILKNPPLDANGQPWILVLEITNTFIMDMVAGIRNDILESVERESFHRIIVCEKQSNANKLELTDELEERIRNHWPRRGRVETQIKQPREAELLGHKEKTWRHITNIQQKMIQAQASFKTCSEDGHNECTNYINDMTNLRNSLNGEFKNLAFLQAIDVKARGLTLDFQNACSSRKILLNKIAEEETSLIINFAKDFRKICPLQVPGIEGGYSESEILEIEALVIGQCEEIESISKEWETSISSLAEEQVQSLKSQDEFTTRYKKATQDVAMSEGLGQKYGAPRRRAQEKIRTEISRDERNAGKLDSLLAELEFTCSEAERQRQNLTITNPEVDDAHLNADLDSNSSLQLSAANRNWNLLLQVRQMLLQRAKYLSIIESSTPLPELGILPWLPKNRISILSSDNNLKDLNEGNHKDLQLMEDDPKMTLSQVFEEVDKSCRKETKDLYDSEGLSSVLGAGGVPDSLQQWLTESKEKLLGKNGYREKTWKRLWLQVQRSENILARHLVLAKKEEKQINLESSNVLEQQSATDLHDTTKYVTKLGIPAICIQSLSVSFINFAKKDKVAKETEFSQLLRVWELGRDKHERLLRPRLGSPDLADELSNLNKMEVERSNDMKNHVLKFRTLLIRTQVVHISNFLEDIGICCKGLLELLDSTLRQELLQVPPDTEVPKKHMTLKKLRKIQRIKETVASGAEDNSQKRTWAGVNLDTISKVIRSSEDLVVDLGSDPRDSAITELPGSNIPSTGSNDKKAAKKTEKNVAPTAEVSKPSLITNSWMAAMISKTSIKSEVSTAHRIVLSERDNVVIQFSDYIANTIDEIRADYDLILVQEKSWNERWARQVEMLLTGNI